MRWRLGLLRTAFGFAFAGWDVGTVSKSFLGLAEYFAREEIGGVFAEGAFEYSEREQKWVKGIPEEEENLGETLAEVVCR